MITGQFRFLGKDGSLGYRKAKVYTLRIKALSNFSAMANGYQIEIHRYDGSGFCPYKNIETFFMNWQQIDTAKMLVLDPANQEVKVIDLSFS